MPVEAEGIATASQRRVDLVQQIGGVLVPSQRVEKFIEQWDLV